ncbi:porin [Burkholderia gladioli]|uniref:porin n=1 Tax=Burkholderia gladioli TaxID=28095 RepID=UPI001640C1C7|nr:porin [Burkholderia gladioli]
MVPFIGRPCAAIPFALLISSACPAAFAQSSVTLYGSLDAGVAYVNNRDGHSQVAVLQGVAQPDRFGLTGTEALGGGWSAVFRLENGFFTNNGALARANTLFSRQAYVGLSSTRYGTLTLGEQSSFNYDWVAPLGNNFQGNNLLAAHPGNLDGLVETTSAQEANLIKYRSAVCNGLSFGLLYGLGGVAGDFSNGRIAGGAASYTNGPPAIAAAYVNEHDRALGPMLGDTTAGLGLSSFQGKPALSYVAGKIENTGVGARYDFGRLRLHAVFTYVRIVSGSLADSYRTWETGATWLGTPANAIVGGIAAAGFIGRHYLTATLGDVHSLSKSTQVYLQAVAQQATGTTDARASIFSVGASGTPRQLAFVTGIHHLF